MKQIRLLVVPDPLALPNDTSNTLDYREMIRQVIRRPFDAQRGADFEEIRKGIRIFDKLDALGDTDVLVLEDADWEHLRDKAKVMPWGVVDRRVFNFVQSILEPAEVSQNGTA